MANSSAAKTRTTARFNSDQRMIALSMILLPLVSVPVGRDDGRHGGQANRVGALHGHALPLFESLLDLDEPGIPHSQLDIPLLETLASRLHVDRRSPVLIDQGRHGDGERFLGSCRFNGYIGEQAD